MHMVANANKLWSSLGNWFTIDYYFHYRNTSLPNRTPIQKPQIRQMLPMITTSKNITRTTSQQKSPLTKNQLTFPQAKSCQCSFQVLQNHLHDFSKCIVAVCPDRKVFLFYASHDCHRLVFSPTA